MAIINILSKDVYNKISAGEVVERPASIVKELFENSVDAGATEITIGIENGGINSIFIQDNGSGIEKSELEKVFMPHATSKICKASDLDSILTLGFRGEAMSSISAVSKVKLVSKTEKEEIGSFITVEGGDITDRGSAQCETGTKITVTGIFYNTPARLKFLKTPKSEEKEVTTLVEKLILANPNVAVKYFVNSKLELQSFGDGLKNAVIAVYSKNTVENCQEIETVKNGIKFEGFLGNINFVKANKTYQTIIVNGRYVTDSTISSAISNAYSSYLMKRQYPFYVLSITVPSEVVDVNVHPKKSEVRFQNNQIIYGTVFSVVSKVIDGSSQALDIIRTSTSFGEINESFDKVHGLDKEQEKTQAEIEEEQRLEKLLYTSDTLGMHKTYESDDESKYPAKTFINGKGELEYVPYDKSFYGVAKPAVSDHLRQRDVDLSDSDTSVRHKYADDIFAENKKYLEEQEALENAEEQSMQLGEDLELIGQLFKTYLLFEGKNVMFLIDQHAAHERLLYDKLLEKVKSRKVMKQQLLIPYCITVNAQEFDMLYDMMDYINEIGFDIGYQDENSFKIYAVPEDFEGMDVGKFIYEILTDEKFKAEKIPTVIREKLMQKACKSAIKAGELLSYSEIDALMGQLKSNLGLKCPHGRPIAIKITRTEIDKWFKRII